MFWPGPGSKRGIRSLLFLSFDLADYQVRISGGRAPLAIRFVGELIVFNGDRRDGPFIPGLWPAGFAARRRTRRGR